MGNSQAWQNVNSGISTGATLANTGLGIYSALNAPKPKGEQLLGASIGPSLSSQSGLPGNQSAPLKSLDTANVGSGGSGGRGMSGSQIVQQQPMTDKHLDILRQLLGVYPG